MPYMSPPQVAGTKRRRAHEHNESKRPRSKTKPQDESAEDSQAQIDRLEAEITESRQHYNNIATLISIAKDEAVLETKRISALVALCRVYSRLMGEKAMLKSVGSKQNELVIIQWLEDRLQEYTTLLLVTLAGEDVSIKSTAITLFMQLVKQELSQASGSPQVWQRGIFSILLRGLLSYADEDFIKIEFVKKYAQQHDDVRFYTVIGIENLLGDVESEQPEPALANAITILSEIGTCLDTDPDTDTYFGYVPEKRNKATTTLHGHRKHVQQAWMSVFRSTLDQQQRKKILNIMARRIVPLFPQPELLMDFLTDCYNEGGSISLLALSGLYNLMVEKNLDYPSFYQKLYSLLDEDLLHSKHRSKFFRLLDEFLTSTHLPAALVASFIKRLSRLALHGPPAGIVVVVPWIYNMLKRHPACTFMIHRETHDPERKAKLEEEGMDDPFDMKEPDPMQTDAIESCLWEIETLQTVYHPNVATLAKIISEQFTKRSYNLDDFLDHSYGGMIDAELGKNMKKAPEVEYEIPKRIFMEDESNLNPLGRLMDRVFESG